MDMVKFRDPKSRGQFTDGAEYAEYVGSTEWIVASLRERAERDKYMSYVDVKDLVELYEKVPEVAVHQIHADMVRNGITWQHLAVLYALTGYRVKPEEQGKLNLQVSSWFRYYDYILD
jgi:hypothetical protein